MTASASKSTTIYSPNVPSYGYTHSVSWSESNPSVSTNKSKISASASLGSSVISFASNYDQHISVYWFDNHKYQNGVKIAGLDFRSCGQGYGTQTVSGSIEVEHKDDGTLSGYCLSYFTNNNGGYYCPSSNSISTDTKALDTIARASIASAEPNPLIVGSGGATVTINTNRKSASFTHDITLSCGTWNSSQTGVGASTTFTVPYTVISEFSSTSKTATCTITCVTKNGATTIGTKESTFILEIDISDDHANIGTITIQDTNARTSAVTQDDSVYISNISTLQATIPCTASGTYTQLAEAVVTCGNIVQTFVLSGTSQTVTFTFDRVDAPSLNVTVKDKRGNAVTKSESWTLIPYQPVTAVATVGRPSATGSTGVGQVTGMAYGGMFGATQNSLTILVDFKKHDESTYSGTETFTLSLPHDGYNSYSDALTFAYSLNYLYQYDIRFSVSDLFSTAEYTAQLMQGLPIISWDESEVDVWGQLHIHDRDNPSDYWNVSVPHYIQYNQTFPAASLMPTQNKVFIINGYGLVFVSVAFMNTSNGTYGTNRCGVEFKALEDEDWFLLTESQNRTISQGSGQSQNRVCASTSFTAKSNDMFRIFYYDSNDSSKILRCQITSIGCRVEEERQTLKLATWNVGLFSDGTHRPTSSTAQAQINKFTSAINGINADVINMQEYPDYVDSTSQYSSASLINYKYGNTLRQGMGKSGSNFPTYDFSTITFTSGSGRMCYSYTIYYNGKPITIINAHLSFEVPAVQRAQDIQQLITYMNAKEYVILTGDFNVYDDSEFNAFTTAGYTLCNGGSFGWFNTWPVWDNMWEGFSTDWPCYHLDNIIVSSNIVPQSVETYTCNISDHAPLVAVFEVN